MRAENGHVSRAFAFIEDQLMVDEGPAIDEPEEAASEPMTLRIAGAWSINPETLADRVDPGGGIGFVGNLGIRYYSLLAN